MTQSTIPHRQSEEPTPFDRRAAITLALRAWKWGFGLSAALALLGFLGESKLASGAGAWAYLALWLENTAEIATLLLPMAVYIILESHSPALSFMAQLRLYFLATVAAWPLMMLAHGNFAVIPPALWNLGLCAGWPLFTSYRHRTDLKSGEIPKSMSLPRNQEKRLTMGNALALLGYLAVFVLSTAGMVTSMYLTQQHFKSVPWTFSDISGSIGGAVGGALGSLTTSLGLLLKKNFKGEAPFKLIGLYAGLLSTVALGIYAADIPMFHLEGTIPWFLIGIVVVATFIFSMVVIGEKGSRAGKAE